MIAKLLMKASEHIGGRFHPAFKKIIQAEVDAGTAGDATEFLKLAMLNLARSPKAMEIIKAELLDSTACAVLGKLGIDISGDPAANDQAAKHTARAAALGAVDAVVKYPPLRRPRRNPAT